MSAMDHVRHLSQAIGPRGSTTAGEEAAAQYASQVLQEIGLDPVTEHFASPASAWRPYVIFAGVALLGELLFPTTGQWGAAIALLLTGAALISVLLELSFRHNPIRWLLRKRQSQNVWGRIEPRSQPKEQVVLLGHLDTHRTPLAFSSPSWLKLFGMLVPLGLGAAVIMIICFAAGIGSLAPTLRLLSFPSALAVLSVFLLSLQADLTPYTVGANDNASGAGVVLSTAKALMEHPLTHTTVWIVLSGCEEVGCYGADAFAQCHADELGIPIWIALDGVGGGGARPAYLTRETFLLTTRSDPNLVALADLVSSNHPELEAHTRMFSGAYTEGAIGGKHGYRVLTLSSFAEDSRLTEWHRLTDTVENMDPEVLERSEAFLWELLHMIDLQAGTEVR